ncbi:hypothetical protein AtubIFM61612_010318 [Aspergillus tubingensis]|nr:hypothetical protein AtubIFM57143_008764 [Aspergillus tubingensis]GLB20386.1 hypothetical protein AtubIFM61612_010318 [Aspergillus tubingensis]
MAIGTYQKLRRDPEKYLEAGQNLSAEEIQVLVDNHESHYILDDAQKRSSRTKWDRTSTPQMALNSAGQIDYIFKYALDLLQQVEKENNITGRFSNDYIDLQSSWGQTMDQSKTLATDMAVQYEDAIIRFEYCSSDDHSAQDRIEVVTKLMKEFEQIEKDQQDMRDKFDGFQKSFSTFSGSFHDWAKDAIEEKQKQIQTLRDAIADLQKQIDDMTKALYVIGGEAVLTVLGTAVCAGIVGPWAPWVMIAGLIFVGAELATVIRLINRVSENDENIKSTRNLQGQLLALHLANLTRVWDMGKSEAEEVYKWLKLSANPDGRKANRDTTGKTRHVEAIYEKGNNAY